MNKPRSSKGNRVLMSLRASPDLYWELRRRAKLSGRTFTQEVEFLLELAITVRDLASKNRAESIQA